VDYCWDYWRFTGFSIKLRFEEAFPAQNVSVGVLGNILAAIAFTHDRAAEELSTEELDYCDPDIEVSLLLKAVKPPNRTQEAIPG